MKPDKPHKPTIRRTARGRYRVTLGRNSGHTREFTTLPQAKVYADTLAARLARAISWPQ